MISFSLNYEYILSNKEYILKLTQTSLDGRTENQIDYCLIEEKNLNLIKNVKSQRRAVADSYHLLVEIIFKQEFPRTQRTCKEGLERYYKR